MAFGLALLLSGAWLAHQLQPLRPLLARARQVADNPLSQRLYSGRNDEFGELDFALRMLEAETGAVVGRMAEALRGSWDLTDAQVDAATADTYWGTRYTLEQILDHAIVHILWHKRQVARVVRMAVEESA